MVFVFSFPYWMVEILGFFRWFYCFCGVCGWLGEFIVKYIKTWGLGLKIMLFNMTKSCRY